MRKTNKNLTKQILTLMLAFAMVFTGMGIGSWGVDKAVALASQDVVFLSTAKAGSPKYQIEPIAGQEKSYNVWIPDSAKSAKQLAFLNIENFTNEDTVTYQVDKGKARSFTGKIGSTMIGKPAGKTVTVTLNEASYTYSLKNSAALSALSVQGKEIAPAYVWSEKEYSVSVSSKTNPIQVNVETNSTADTRKITVNNQEVTLTKGSGSIEVPLSPLSWSEDNTATIPIKVSDTSLEKGSEYTLKVEGFFFS